MCVCVCVCVRNFQRFSEVYSFFLAGSFQFSFVYRRSDNDAI